MPKKQKEAIFHAISCFAFSLVLILCLTVEAIPQQFVKPPLKIQPKVITVTAGKSANVLVPWRLPNTQARLMTIPRKRGERRTPVPHVTVVTGNQGKTGRYYSISTTTETPPGTYQLLYFDSQKRRWNAVPTNVVQVKVAAPQFMVTKKMSEKQVITKTTQKGSVAIDTVPLPEKVLAMPKSSTPMPKTSASTTAKTAQKDSVAIDTVPVSYTHLTLPTTPYV